MNRLKCLHRRVLWLMLLTIVCPIVYSCQYREADRHQSSSKDEIDSIDFAYPVQLRYAKGLAINNYETYKEIIVFVPGIKDTLATYILYPRRAEKPQNLRAKDIAIAVPVQRIACLSTPQVGTLPLLGASERLVGAGKLENISNPEIRRLIDEGKVLEIGRGMSENKEAILMARPEVLMQDFSNVDEQDAELMKAGIIPFLFNSWKEQDLLGRAEWLKVSGMLLGVNQRADSVFSNIYRDYLEAKQIATEAPDTIPILYGLDYKGTWYIPGEYSYPTAMFRDAGLKYEYIPRESNSTPVSFEYVFSRHRHAKIWISVMTGKIYTKADFVALNERYNYFDAVKQGGKIFLDCRRVNEWGGERLLGERTLSSRPHPQGFYQDDSSRATAQPRTVLLHRAKVIPYASELGLLFSGDSPATPLLCRYSLGYNTHRTLSGDIRSLLG